MTPKKDTVESLFDKSTSHIQGQQMTSAEVEQATQRVWARLGTDTSIAEAELTSVDQIRTCSDFQSLIPAFLAGRLTSARSLLVEDHTRECVPCRKALKEAKNGTQRKAQPAGIGAVAGPAIWKRYSIAASFLIGFALLGLVIAQFFLTSVDAGTATVVSVDGDLYRIGDTENRRLAVGERVTLGEIVRTGNHSRAQVRLSNNAVVELDERTEFSLRQATQGSTIQLERGSIILQAPTGVKGALFVSTDDSLISGKDMILAVNHGTKGSRVSCIQGTGTVSNAGKDQPLQAGQQFTSSTSVEKLPIQEEISWSKDADRYAKLLEGLQHLYQDLDQTVPRPGLRTTPRLLPMLPDNTVFYLALPNIGESLVASQQIVEKHLQQNPELAAWWKSEKSATATPQYNQILAEIRTVSGFLGNEIVITAAGGTQIKSEPVVLAEVKDEAGLRNYLTSHLAGTTGKMAFQLISDAELKTPVTAAGEQAILGWIQNGTLVLATSRDGITQAVNRMQSSKSAPAGSLLSAIEAEYKNGVELMLAIDLSQMNDGAEAKAKADGSKAASEFSNFKHLIVNLKEVNGETSNRAVVTFKQPKKGIATWISSPGPMGSLSFISPDASLVSAFVVENPAGMLTELFDTLQQEDPTFLSELQALEAKHGLRIREDFAAYFGGEVAFAVDGPMLPTPAWKLVMEVNDPVKLQASFAKAIVEVNSLIKPEENLTFSLDSTTVDGQVYHTVRKNGTAEVTTYTFAHGYMVAAPTQSLVSQALRYYESGISLVSAPRFISALPKDGNTNFSMLMYQNLTPMLTQFADSSNEKKPEGLKLGAMAAAALPTLAYAYVNDDQMIFALGGDGIIKLSPTNLLTIPGSIGLQALKGHPEKAK
ncbi:MAG TPA: FecR domain-containing protein [Acidobacteriota bacterium]|nr:FecR domain-containing protein [Acidobacteriota bacterium]